MKTIVVILAAGKSTRFDDVKSKLLQQLGELPVVSRVVQAAYYAGYPCLVVVGHQKDAIVSAIEKDFPEYCSFVEQEPLLGTGHALGVAFKEFNFSGLDNLVVVNGDSPFVTADLLKQFILFCENKYLDVGVVAALAPNPFGYGRLIFSGAANFHVIEERFLDNEQKSNRLVNGGIYFFSKVFLDAELSTFINSQLQMPEKNEIFITDFLNLASDRNYILGHCLAPFDLVRGINSLDQYDEAKTIIEK